MRVLFISRSTLFTVHGGDTVQMEHTAAELQRLGIAVDIELCKNKSIDYQQYDLIHFFNIIRPADILYHIDKSGLPFVVSPVYVEYHGLPSYSWQQKIINKFERHWLEYIKVIGRSIKNREKIVSWKYLWLGHRRSIEYILKKCSHLLPNSHSEYARLKRDFTAASNYHVIPNAIDTSIFSINDEEWYQKEPDTVLCVARFEPRKNQLEVIRALSGTDYKVTFVGNIAPNHYAYYEACKRAASGNIHFLDFAEPEKVAELYRINKVHILASWFETTGLSTLEAIACGCNVVISKKGDTEEYFGSKAIYCNPADQSSIKAAVDKAMKSTPDRKHIEDTIQHYNWEVSARETAVIYKQCIGSQGTSPVEYYNKPEQKNRDLITFS